jgi:ATP-binding cassette, subfamily B, bacterial PglK
MSSENPGTFAKVLALLSRREKKRGLLLLAMVTFMALFETLGIASIMPFLAVLGNPEMVQQNEYLSWAYETFGFASTNRFLMALGLMAFFTVLFSALFRVITHYALNRYTQMRRHSLSMILLETYLRQPYAYFLDRNSGDMSKTILSEVDQIVGNVLKPGFTAAAYSTVALAIVIFLVALDPLLALILALGLGGSYALIFFGVRGYLTRIGRERANANKQRFTTAGEALGGIKDIKLLGRELAYLSRFKPASIRFARSQATNATLSAVPKFVIEAVGIGAVLALALYLLAAGGGLENILPILGVYALAGYKLLPAIQHIYAGIAKMRFGAAAVDDIYEDLEQRKRLAQIPRKPGRAIAINERVALRNVTFTYPGAENPALFDIELEIPARSSLGIIGPTGAGKTTLVDIILGLLRPQQGNLEVDGQAITDQQLRRWQASIGYVPQDIFLTDASIRENIALGIEPGFIDEEAVLKAAQMAQIDQFIHNELSQKYDTIVGERGVRLSGGQRQRIGIARALYHDPPLLVFDEATSALDNETERQVMEAIEVLTTKKTIILVAHRLSTVKACDSVVMLRSGMIHQQGVFSTLEIALDSN